MQEGHCKEKSSKHAPRALANVVANSLMTARHTRCDVAGKKTKRNEKAHRKLTARKKKQPRTRRLHYVSTNSLMSAWRTPLAKCAAIIAIFAFRRWNAASPLPLSSAADSRTPK